MTAQDIIDKLFTEIRPVTRERIEKAKGLCARSGVPWNVLLLNLTADQLQVVDANDGT